MKTYFEFDVRPKDIVFCLTSEFQWLSLLKNRSKPYELLLDYLIELGEIEKPDEDNYDGKKYLVTQISKNLNISSTKIRKWIFQIYDDLLELNIKEPKLFYNGNPYHYIFTFESTYGYYPEFNLWLPIMLNRFDNFTFEFINAKVNRFHFWVENIRIVHKYGEMAIEVNLCEGLYNSYEQFLKDKVYFWKSPFFNELYYLNNYDLKEELKKIAQKDRF